MYCRITKILSGWFRDFIKGYADITKDLYAILKGKQVFKWREIQETAFLKVKQALREAGNLKLPEYDKKFVLKTDASNTGLGAVLMQENNEGKLVPIQWASKKLTATEERYAITEKEMLAVKWGIEKFSYELKGRQFHLITDHRALEHIRDKPEFENQRINRWIESIQSYNFTIEYRKGEDLVTADALSRIYEEEKKSQLVNEKQKETTEHGRKIKEGVWNKHVVEIEEETYWKFDSGILRKIPPIEIRKSFETHEKLLHRGVEPIYHNLKREYYWPGIKETIVNVVKKCQICIENNRKQSGGSDFVTTSRPWEKVAIDIMKINEEEINVLVTIDYYTRYLNVAIIENRRSETIMSTLQNIFKKSGWPEEIISDNGKEFCASEFENMCKEFNIKHTKVSVESHRSNGRVERVIGTLREGLAKRKEGTITQKLECIKNAYNMAYHAGIKMSPAEALQDESGVVNLENSKEGKYNKQFKRGKREKFKEGQQILIAKRENLGATAKTKRGRYLKKGVIIGTCTGDSYVVKDENGKINKKRHYDLKGHGVKMSETPSKEGDVILYK
jgi:transposase InsO family protein